MALVYHKRVRRQYMPVQYYHVTKGDVKCQKQLDGTEFRAAFLPGDDDDDEKMAGTPPHPLLLGVADDCTVVDGGVEEKEYGGITQFLGLSMPTGYFTLVDATYASPMTFSRTKHIAAALGETLTVWEAMGNENECIQIAYSTQTAYFELPVGGGVVLKGDRAAMITVVCMPMSHEDVLLCAAGLNPAWAKPKGDIKRPDGTIILRPDHMKETGFEYGYPAFVNDYECRYRMWRRKWVEDYERLAGSPQEVYPHHFEEHVSWETMGLNSWDAMDVNQCYELLRLKPYSVVIGEPHASAFKAVTFKIITDLGPYLHECGTRIFLMPPIEKPMKRLLEVAGELFTGWRKPTWRFAMLNQFKETNKGSTQLFVAEKTGVPILHKLLHVGWFLLLCIKGEITVTMVGLDKKTTLMMGECAWLPGHCFYHCDKPWLGSTITLAF